MRSSSVIGPDSLLLTPDDNKVWPVNGRRDTGLSLALVEDESDHVTWILASQWSMVDVIMRT